jgi:hypothetical protein
MQHVLTIAIGLNESLAAAGGERWRNAILLEFCLVGILDLCLVGTGAAAETTAAVTP